MSEEELRKFQAMMIQSWVDRNNMTKEEAIALFKEIYEFEVRELSRQSDRRPS